MGFLAMANAKEAILLQNMLLAGVWQENQMFTVLECSSLKLSVATQSWNMT